MSKPRQSDRTGWRPGCFIMLTDDIPVPVDKIDPDSTFYFRGIKGNQKTAPTHEFTGHQIRNLVTLADVTIAKACVRMP